MSNYRPEWLERKISFTLQRQRHAREAPPDCPCPLCLADRGELAETLKRINAERRPPTEIPF